MTSTLILRGEKHVLTVVFPQGNAIGKTFPLRLQNEKVPEKNLETWVTRVYY